MKQKFLKFPARPTRYAPAIQSRRSGVLRHITAAYKSDGKDADEDPELKTLLQNLGVTAKDLVEKHKTMEVELKAAKTEAETAKKDVGETKSALEETKKEVGELKAAAVTRDEADKKNQEALNKLIAERKELEGVKKEKKTFNEALSHAMTEATDDITKFANKEIKEFSIELKDVGDISTANVTGGDRYGQLMQPGIIENPKRRVHVRDLITGGMVGAGNSLTYMKEDGPGEGNPAPFAENQANPKAQFDMDLKEVTVQIETIAGLVKATRKAMKNIPGFISFLQSRMPERLMRVEDEQILYGDGATPNIKGLLTAGNFQNTNSISDIFVEKIIDDIARLEDDFERDATGIVMRPKNYYSFFKNKAAGSGEYDLPQGIQFINGILYILGVPVAPTTAIHDGDYVVGDFAMGAQFLIQEAMRIEFFEQDGDNVQRNKVTVRIEETVTLPVYGEDYFIKGAVPA